MPLKGLAMFWLAIISWVLLYVNRQLHPEIWRSFPIWKFIVLYTIPSIFLGLAFVWNKYNKEK